MSKHTTGEWTYDQEIRDIERGGEHIQQSLNLEVYGGEDCETKICEVFGRDNKAGGYDDWAYTPEAKANARLIAASPDMLEALQVIVDSGIIEELAEVVPANDKETFQSIADQIRAAIFTATGEKS